MTRHAIRTNMTTSTTLGTYKLVSDSLIFWFEPTVLTWLEAFSQGTIQSS